MILVLDASPLIAFYSENELGEPSLFHELTKKGFILMIPTTVFEEIKNGRRPTFLTLAKAIREKKIQVNRDISSDETISFGKRHPRLHAGEIQVLLLGLRFKGSGVPHYCVIDEGPGRTIAERNGIAVKGTKGLITMLNQLGIIEKDKMESLLYRLDHCTFRA
jgi:predicted nucleic acid-binding protein